MTLKFHNTLTDQVDEFVSQTEGKVSLYTCGPTVYSYLHVGNWAAYIYWDILVRILMANNYEVNRVINVTDVGHLTSDADSGEDKLEKSARREGKTAWEIAKFYTEDFINGMKKLNLIIPQHIAKATDYIPQQLDLIRKLKEKGFTYQITDGIYFDTSKFPTYADFAHLDLGAQQPSGRIEINHEKRNPSDFALWKFTTDGQKRDMEWETPGDLVEDRINTANQEQQVISNEGSRAAGVTVIEDTLEPESEMAPGPNSDPERSSVFNDSAPKGELNNQPAEPVITEEVAPYNPKGDQDLPKGFPGWHLECSAIAMDILGSTLDIHTGGIDAIPVHHTNEIAQSEAATGVRFSNFWLHNNFMKVNDTKISKSLGNGFTLDDLEKRGFSPFDFRMFVLQGNYRSEGNFTFDNLQAAKNRLNNWHNTAALRHQIHDTLQDDNEKITDDKTISVYTPSQLLIEAVDDDLNTPAALKIIDEAFSKVVGTDLVNIHRQAFVQLLETIDSLLGLQLIDSTPDISDEAKQIILERKSARVQKDWAKSDTLRDQLLAMNIIIRDTQKDSIWEYKY